MTADRPNAPPFIVQRTAATSAPSAAPLFSATGLDKRFPGVHALDRVDFELRAGEIHALMGENGAGKSTLIRLITGAATPDGGRMTVKGSTWQPASPAEAQAGGVSAVYQEIKLVPTLSVAENLLLGQLPRSWWGLNWSRMRRRARDLLARFALDVDPAEILARLPVAIQQMVAIARAVRRRAAVLILDEPTSSLDASETRRLFDHLRRLRTDGLGIIFVTHFLEQVYEVSDRITVLRNGRHVGTFPTRDLPRQELVAHMLGRTITPPRRASINASAATSQRPLAACATGLARRHVLHPLNVELRRGEVLGLAGLLGSGRTETARLLFGADRADAGTIEFAADPQPPATSADGGFALTATRAAAMRPRRAIARGMALLPENRQADALFPDMSVSDNITIVAQRRLARFGLISPETRNRVAERLVRQLGIKCASLAAPVKTLSGGNQQKVILARWLACSPIVLLLDEPTRGIDVGAKAEVESLIDELRAGGVAILLISSELDEIARRSDRVLVLRDRRAVGEVAGEALDEATLMARIAG